MAYLFPGFVQQRIKVDDVTINLVAGGSGAPLLLLHGYPQTHVIWHKVAPHFASHFTVICPDLRGYGDSSKPVGRTDHSNYSKRAMARDQVELMEQLGFNTFFVMGHDRGGRIAHRMALDHPERVLKLALVDISPTKKMYEGTNMEFATAYYHWFFLIQPTPLPETLIAADRTFYLHSKMRGWGSGGLQHFSPEALAEYERCFTPQMIHASCEDYRASASIDLEHDRADMKRKIKCPVLVLWGERGVVHRVCRPLSDWDEVATNVRGKALPSGHYLAEEVPDLLMEEALGFFGDAHASAIA